jgi:PAS domain S-box-containing protein
MQVGFEVTALVRARQQVERLVSDLQAERTRLEEVLAAEQEARKEIEGIWQQLEAIFAAMTDGVFVYDAQGHIVRMNEAARMLLARYTMADDFTVPLQVRAERYGPRSPEGNPLPPEQVPSLRILHGEVLTGSKTTDVLMRTFEGEDLWLSMSGTPLRDEQGQITGAIAIARDVTVQRRMERRTREALDALLAIAEILVTVPVSSASEVAPALFMTTDLAHRLLELTCQVMGCENATFVSREPDTDVAHLLASVGFTPEQERIIRANVEGIRFGDRYRDPAFLARLHGGEVQLLDLTSPPFRDQRPLSALRQALVAPIRLGGTLVGVISLNRSYNLYEYTEADLALARGTARLAGLVLERERLLREREAARTAEYSLRQANQRLTDLIELAHDAIIVRDPQSRIVFWNQGAEQLYGWRAEEAMGQITHVLLATQFADSRQAVDRQLVEQGRWEGVLTHLRHDGTPVIVESRQVLVRDEAGEPEAILEINRDITEQERLLQERAQAQARELAAHEARERMDAFLGMTSHELKTPLATIKGNLQLARRRLNTTIRQPQSEISRLSQQLAEIQSLLERAERQVGVQNRLVSDLLDVSRIQVGHLDLRLEHCDLAAIVGEVVEDQRVAAAPRTIHLELPGRQAVAILADAGRIEQVVSNYVTNAVKYSSPELPIAVRLEVEDGVARLSVQDEGPGLAPEEQELIWERFYRGAGNERQHVPGASLGLGLYICRTIIEQHSGQVGVTSTEGQGSTFWFTLPLVAPVF